MKIMQHIERALFGATAEEAAEMRLRLIDQRIARAFDRVADALDQDESEPDESNTKGE